MCFFLFRRSFFIPSPSFPPSLITHHFTTADPPTARVLATDPGPTGPGSRARAAAALRALRACGPPLSRCWDVSPLSSLLTDADPATRWTAAECLALAAGLDDAPAAALRGAAAGGEEAALAAELAADADAAAAAVERAAAWLAWDGGRVAAHAATASSPPAPPPGHVDVEGVWLPTRGGAATPSSALPTPPFVRTPTSAAALRAAALALADGRPLLLTGPPGSGKSATARALAAAVRAGGDAVVLHAGDAADARSLLGCYVAGDRPGSFAWAAGPLALAVTQGRWCVLEGAHVAPADALAALAPLLDGGPLPVPSRGDVLIPAPGFQLVATATTGGGGGALAASRGGVLDSGGWARVALPPPPRAHAAAVLEARLPPGLGADLAAGGLDCLAVARAAEGLDTPSAAAVAALAAAGLSPGGARSGRHPSLRDACRWAARVASRVASPGGGGGGGGPTRLPAALRELAAADAADVFAAAHADPAARASLTGALAAVWGLPAAWGAARAAHGLPDVSIGGRSVRVGRVDLPVPPSRSDAGLRASRARAGGSGGATFAATGASRRALEAVAAAVGAREPALLVGESGAGKTTAVQWLAGHVGARLEVINLSQSSDAADLLGGFRPAGRSGGGSAPPPSAAAAVAALVSDLSPLLAATWPRGGNDAFLAAATKAASRKQWDRVVAACRVALKKVRGERR